MLNKFIIIIIMTMIIIIIIIIIMTNFHNSSAGLTKVSLIGPSPQDTVCPPLLYSEILI
jgi:hypothetical protein